MWLNKTQRHIKYLTLKALELRILLFCLIKSVSRWNRVEEIDGEKERERASRVIRQLQKLHMDVSAHVLAVPDSYQILFTNVIMRHENSLKNSSATIPAVQR